MVTWRQRLRDLLCVKSIVTILLTVVFVALTLAGRVSSQEFLTIFSVVIAFILVLKVSGQNTGSAGNRALPVRRPKKIERMGGIQVTLSQRRGRIPDRIKATHKTGGNPEWT